MLPPPPSLQQLGDLAVQGTAAKPRDVGVQRLAAERVAEGRPAALRPRRSQPWRISSDMPVSVASRPTSWRSNSWPATAPASAAARASSDSWDALISTASRIVSGTGTSSPPRSRPRGPAWSRPLASSAPAISSTKNGTPWVRSCRARTSAGDGGSGSSSPSRSPVSSRSSGARIELLQLAAAAQLVAQPAQLVVARQPVRAVGGDHGDRHLPERRRERREQLERHLVGPVQIVEHRDDRRGPRPSARAHTGGPRRSSLGRWMAPARPAPAAAAPGARSAARTRPGPRAPRAGRSAGPRPPGRRA